MQPRTAVVVVDDVVYVLQCMFMQPAVTQTTHTQTEAPPPLCMLYIFVCIAALRVPSWPSSLFFPLQPSSNVSRAALIRDYSKTNRPAARVCLSELSCTGQSQEEEGWEGVDGLCMQT